MAKKKDVEVSDFEQIETICLDAQPDVGTNGMLIDWPSDQFGITKDLKAVVRQLASRIAGHADKKALVDSVLIMAIAHIKLKFDADAEARELRLQEAAEA